ncbi:Putative disease resistance RPP13-like protein 2 [Triticum urartu]|uniref:Putative disease resistance RPP13-like protein 2 n=1 Tax=Triticum urartu TaxID=4572 RepID=M7YNI2_TRIUA|nr:Putative disease resistance RPP13-like protein 2 [Triticum urartu]
MDVAAGAMTPLINKLGSLLLDEYSQEKRVRKSVKSLITELEMMHAVLRKIGTKPPEQFDEQVLIWAGKVRELSYHMEDAVDTFIVRVEDVGHDRGSTNMKNRVKKFLKRATKLFNKGKALHHISDAIEEAQWLAKELGDLRQRYMIEEHANGNGDAVDPRLKAVYKHVTELVGIDHLRDELIKKLCDGNQRSKGQLRTMSIVGSGGLGKTTLAKAAYDKIKVQFDSVAFVSVSRNPDMTKIFKKILHELDKSMYTTINEVARDHEQLLDELRKFLQDKRYLIVIDDIWDEEAWEFIKVNRGKIFVKWGKMDEILLNGMKPLTEDDSERLFYKRIFPQGKGGSGKDMQRILSFSYYDLPSHLKTCLLYLSIFPEDFEIRRDRLIWMWIAEGFVQGGKQGTALFELGESYFNELANRNLIQPVHVNAAGKVEACRVHDMVLDLLCSLSSEQNFATILDGSGTQQSKSISHRKSRRLSFQNSMSEPSTNLVDATSMPQVRSVVLFKADIDLIQNISCFQVLRVLDLEGCDFGRNPDDVDLRYIKNLLHLRYLGLRRTHVRELPVEIGKLQFLETLDLADNGSSVAVIPSSVVRLRRLMFLDVANSVLPAGIGNLTSLEELKGKLVDVKELGQLVELRVLYLFWNGNDESMCNSLVVSLGKLRKMQRLTIYVDRLQPEVDIQILGKLPALRSLWLWTSQAQPTHVETFVVGANAFPCLRECRFFNFHAVPSMFPRGAMPRLEIMHFTARASDIAGGDLSVGMGHLPSLQQVTVCLWVEKGSTSDKCNEEADAVLRHAVDTHPNRPTLQTYQSSHPDRASPAESTSLELDLAERDKVHAARTRRGQDETRPPLP